MNSSEINNNPETDVHAIIEAGYKYVMPHSLYGKMKLYLVQYVLMSRWYRQLSDDDRQKVQRLNVYTD